MTTGRINQVTIFEGGPVARRRRETPRPRQARVGVSQVIGVTEHPVGRPPLEPNRRGVPRPPSICRDCFPQGEVRRRTRANQIAGPNFRMPASRGGYSSTVTSVKTATGPRACPRVRQGIDGHRPITHRLPSARDRLNRRNRLRAPPARRRRVGRTNSQRRGGRRDECQCNPPS